MVQVYTELTISIDLFNNFILVITAPKLNVVIL